MTGLVDGAVQNRRFPFPRSLQWDKWVLSLQFFPEQENNEAQSLGLSRRAVENWISRVRYRDSIR